MENQNPQVCIVIPAYNEGAGLRILIDRVEEQLAATPVNASFLVVDDGSTDRTWEELKTLTREKAHVSALRFSRNFGKEAALAAGLEQAVGEAVVVMDADLQHPPELLPQMIAAWRERGAAIVHAVKANRAGESAVRQVCSRLLFGVTRLLSGMELSRSADFKLLDRRVVEAWRTMPERTLFFRGIVDWLGFPVERLEFDVAPRAVGQSKWGVFGLAGYALNAVNSFTAQPLKIVSLLCLLFLMVSSLAGVKVLYDWITGHTQEGFPTVILLSVLFGDTVMISLALLSWYMAKIFEEVKQRPRYVISQKIGEGK